MNRDQKAAVVDEIADQIQASEAVFAIDYRGISVPQIAELRAKLRDADTSFRVVKNSLSERAADKAGAEDLKEMLNGPTALALVRGDAALAAKALNDTARQLRILDFKGGLLGGKLLTSDEVRAIARLPAREVLHAQLVGTIAAPLTGLVRGLNALIGGLAIQLQQIAEKGLVSGSGSPAGPDPARSAAADLGDSATAAQDEAPQPADEGEKPEPEAAVAPPAAEPEAAAEPISENDTEQDAAPDAESDA